MLLIFSQLFYKFWTRWQEAQSIVCIQSSFNLTMHRASFFQHTLLTHVESCSSSHWFEPLQKIHYKNMWSILLLIQLILDQYHVHLLLYSIYKTHAISISLPICNTTSESIPYNFHFHFLLLSLFGERDLYKL